MPHWEDVRSSQNFEPTQKWQIERQKEKGYMLTYVFCQCNCVDDKKALDVVSYHIEDKQACFGFIRPLY